MRGAFDDADALAFEADRRDLQARAVAPAGEAAGRVEIAVGEVDLGVRARGNEMAGDHSVGLALAKGAEQVLPRARDDVADDIRLQADRAGEVDVEAGQLAVLVECS